MSNHACVHLRQMLDHKHSRATRCAMVAILALASVPVSADEPKWPHSQYHYFVNAASFADPANIVWARPGFVSPAAAEFEWLITSVTSMWMAETGVNAGSGVEPFSLSYGGATSAPCTNVTDTVYFNGAIVAKNTIGAQPGCWSFNGYTNCNFLGTTTTAWWAGMSELTQGDTCIFGAGLQPCPHI